MSDARFERAAVVLSTPPWPLRGPSSMELLQLRGAYEVSVELGDAHFRAMVLAQNVFYLHYLRRCFRRSAAFAVLMALMWVWMLVVDGLNFPSGPLLVALSALWYRHLGLTAGVQLARRTSLDDDPLSAAMDAAPQEEIRHA